MNLLLQIPFIGSKQFVPRQVRSNSWADRDVVLSPDVNLFCWERQVDLHISHYLNQLLDGEFQHIQKHVTIHEVETQINEIRATHPLHNSISADLFWKDVYQLTRDFLSFSLDGTGTMHLKSVTDNGCAKFHTDGYRLRLFTSYCGPGTEWLPENAVNRRHLGKTNDLIVKRPDLIQRMNAFEVGIIKGELPKSIEVAKGIVHRSPPINGQGLKRLILRVDIP